MIAKLPANRLFMTIFWWQGTFLALNSGGTIGTEWHNFNISSKFHQLYKWRFSALKFIKILKRNETDTVNNKNPWVYEIINDPPH